MNPDDEYKYCPVCKKKTYHEGGRCEECGKLPLESVKEYEECSEE